MATDAWYSPDALADQADGTKTQPEFAPEALDSETEAWAGDPEVGVALVTYTDALRTTIAGFTQTYPTVSADETITL